MSLRPENIYSPAALAQIAFFCVSDGLSTFADLAHIASRIFLIPPPSSVNSIICNTLMAMCAGADSEIIAALPIVDVVPGMKTRPRVVGNLVALQARHR